MTLEKITIIISITLVVICLLAILFSIIIYRKNIRKTKLEYAETKNSLRVFVLKIKSGECVSFNRSNLSRKKQSTITQFYNEFPSEERQRLILWIGDLLDPSKDAPKYLDINVLVNKNKKSYFSMLLVEKIDYHNQIIHINSYLLKYMTRHSALGKENVRFLNREDFIKSIENSKQQKGMTFCLIFYYSNPGYIDKEISHLAFTKIKDVLLNYCSKEILFNEYSNHQILISHLSIYTKSKAMQFIKTISNDILKILTLHSLSDLISFSFGAAENNLFIGNAKELISNIVSVADIAKEDNVEITWYQQGMKLDELGDLQSRTEVERIIKEKRLKYLSRPIYDVTNNKILGYESITKPIETIFDNIFELKKYAAKTGDDKELFSTVARNAISRFISEKNDLSSTVFFPVSYQEIPYLFRTLSHISDVKDINIVLTFDEIDFENASFGNAEDSIANQLRLFKSRGYEVAIFLQGTQLALPHEIYAMSDYFFIDVSDISVKQVATARNITSLHGLIERLLPFKRKIITINIANWSATELMMKLGIEYISGDVIAPSDEMVLPLSPKSIKKINSINNI